MTRSAAHTLATADDPKRTFKLHDAALLRSSNPSAVRRMGRSSCGPTAAAPGHRQNLHLRQQVLHPRVAVSFEATFTADRSKTIWNPSEPGVSFREVPDAPRPAESAVGRSRQMRSLAAGFSSEYTAQHLDNKPFALRLLAQPLYRYETEDDAKADGAMFAFVQSTAAVALLILESRPTREGRRWHYAFASMVSGPVTAKYADKEVASIEKDYSRQTKPSHT